MMVINGMNRADPAPNPAVMKPETVPRLSGNHFNAVATEPL